MKFWAWSHNFIGLHVYAIPTLILALAALIVILVHCRKRKKRKDDAEKELERKLGELIDGAAASADGSTPAAGEAPGTPAAAAGRE